MWLTFKQKLIALNLCDLHETGIDPISYFDEWGGGTNYFFKIFMDKKLIVKDSKTGIYSFDYYKALCLIYKGRKAA